MKGTTVILHTDYQAGQIDRRIFGGFIEHLGRCVYGGVYDPQSRQADENGFRADVLSALRRLNVTAMRYPGGNFVSGYHWQDGIGPKADRPTTFEAAWQTIEPNQFGTDEFMKLSKLLGWIPMFAVNLGTGSPEEARNWVEYCNLQVGTRYADLRKKNGNAAPYDITLWCLGNEMDGPWQTGHVPAEQYAIRAQQAAKMMKDADPRLELVASGSSGNTIPTYLEWDRQVLEYLGDYADYVSMHRYVGNPERKTGEYLGVTNSIDQQIEDMDAMCRFVQAKKHTKKRAYLAFDEWNVWYRTGDSVNTADKAFPRKVNEEMFNLEDTLVSAGFLNSFIRHAGMVKIANIAQMVNVAAPIYVEGEQMLLQSNFYILEMFSKRGKGISLQPVVKGPGYEAGANGYVTNIDSSAILDGDRVHVFLVNRAHEGSQWSAQAVSIDLAGSRLSQVESAEILSGADPAEMNTFEAPNRLTSQKFTNIVIEEGQAKLEMPPLSVLAVTFKVE